MSFNPAGTRWSVAAFDNNGALGGFHPVPWEFHRESMNAGNLWYGGYRVSSDSASTFTAEIFMAGNTAPADQFEVVFVTADRFVATKNGALYRFGKKL
jgi:hypothetical protein